MYVYLSFVLYFTLMPIIVKLPFILNHPYTPMNMVPFVDVLLGRGDFFRQVVLNVIMTIPFGSDIKDLITNMTGGMIGYCFYIIFKPVTDWISQRLKENN